VLPSIFPSFAKKCKALGPIYPVIGGGAVLQECARSDVKANTFIKDLFSEDVDIKIIIMDEHWSKKKKNADALIQIRKDFLSSITKKLNSFVKKTLKPTGMQVDIRESYSMLNHPLEKVRNWQVFTLENEYIDGGGKRHVLSIMDTSLFAKENQKYYDSYQKLVKSPTSASPTSLPIPYNVIKGVNYATCNYAYYDTVRMMMDRMHFFEERRSMYAFIKLARYIIKFMCLYVLLKKKPNIDPVISKVYKKVHSLLKGMEKKRLDIDLAGTRDFKYSTPEVGKMNRVIKRIIRVTKLTDLVKIVDHDKQLTPK
jgi:hypothetical protein